MAAKPSKTITDSRQHQHNRARIRIDCRCRIVTPAGQVPEHYLGESCQTERVGCARSVGIFMQPNADFRAVYSRGDMAIFKSWERNSRRVMLVPPPSAPPERQVIPTREAFRE